MISVRGLGLYAGAVEIATWSLTGGVDTLPGIFSQLGLQIVVTQDFQAPCLSLDVGQLNLVIYVLSLFYIVSISLFF